MWIIGLTGAIGAGKSTLAKYLECEGIPVHSSDKEVHHLMKTDPEVQQKIKSLCPTAFHKGKVDRLKLREFALSSPNGLLDLETILYPRLTQNQKKFVIHNQKLKHKVIALDVPLLFEMGLNRYCHLVILASTPLFLRKMRVLRRKGLNTKQFEVFESHQMRDDQRKKRANFVISCGADKGSALKKIKEILKTISEEPIPKWQGRWPSTLTRISNATRNRFRH